jgi:hypothetical protein
MGEGGRRVGFRIVVRRGRVFGGRRLIGELVRTPCLQLRSWKCWEGERIDRRGCG